MPESDQEAGPDFLAAILGSLTAGVIALDEDFTVTWRSRAAREMAPEVEPGLGLYEALAPFAHEQKIDRLLLRREMVTISFGPDRRDIEWLNCREPLAGGGWVLMLWPSRWTDQLNDRRVDFTMAASHELRTPMTVLLGFAELLRMDSEGLSPGQVEAVEMIEQTARHLRTLVDDIFDLTKNSFGELRLALREIDVGKVVGAVADALQPQVEERGQALEVEIAPDLPATMADPARIRQITSNLIGNASVHNQAGTKIAVRLEAVADGVELTIEDDGAGIGFDDPDDAFHSFSRGKAAIDGDLAGSGIGLSVAKRMVELHRGRLELETAPGEGTRFTVWLPRDRAEALVPGEPGPV